MNKPIFVIFTFLLFFLFSCNDCTKDEELIQRENALILKEKGFAEKELDYASLLKMRDSIQSEKDSAQITNWPDSLTGRWNSKIVCIDSDCTDYVIGDQRVDVWEFTEDSTGLIARVLNNKNEIIRTYNAQYSPDEISLAFKTDSLAEKKVSMNVHLNNLKSGRISGKRTISINDACKAQFNVELMRPSAP